jgi:hypothetical protein
LAIVWVWPFCPFISCLLLRTPPEGSCAVGLGVPCRISGGIGLTGCSGWDIDPSPARAGVVRRAHCFFRQAAGRALAVRRGVRSGADGVLPRGGALGVGWPGSCAGSVGKSRWRSDLKVIFRFGSPAIGSSETSRRERQVCVTCLEVSAAGQPVFCARCSCALLSGVDAGFGFV